MIEVRRLTSDGLKDFQSWLENTNQAQPAGYLLDGADHTEPAYDILIDPATMFATRYEFGTYLVERFGALNFRELMNEQNDGLWAWLAIVYFAQLTEKGRRRKEHYLVVRKGPMGSLSYRQAARSSFELVHIHGQKSLVCLGVSMHTFGDMAEQLASRQALAHNRGFFEAAFDLYVREGKLRRGASSKPKRLKKRKPGDRTGLGGARRLAGALQRLELTFDTEIMDSNNIIGVLPREFAKWQTATP